MALVAYVFGFQRLFQSCGPAREVTEALQPTQKVKPDFVRAKNWGAGVGQCFAGAGSPQKMGRWDRAVFRWDLIPAKN